MDELASTTANPDSVAQWTRLMLLPRAILSAHCCRGRPEEGTSQATLVKDRIKRWIAGDIDGLWRESKGVAVRGRGRKKKGTTTPPTQEQLNARRANKLIAEGQYGRAAQALTSNGVATVSADSFQEMRAKHPQRAVPNLQPDPSAVPLVLHRDKVAKSVRGFKKGSAPGTSGLRAEHLKVAINCGSPVQDEKTVTALTKFCNLLLSGGVPPEFASFSLVQGSMGPRKRMEACDLLQWVTL